MTLNQAVILYYSGGPNIITRVLKNEWRQKGVRERNVTMKTGSEGCCHADCEDGEVGQEISNPINLQQMERQENGFFPNPPERNTAEPTS